MAFLLYLCVLALFSVVAVHGAEFDVNDHIYSRIKTGAGLDTTLLSRRAPSQEGTSTIPSRARRERPSLYSLIDGRYPDARSLPSVLSSLPDSPEGRKVVETLLAYVRNKTGYTLPASWVDLALNDSYTLLDGTAVTPTNLHELTIAINLELGPVNYTSASTDPRVPSGFVWPDDIDNFFVNMSNYIPSIEPIGADLWLGFFFPNTTSMKQAKINVVTSFILNQLSDNLSLQISSPNWFILKYNGKSITSVEGFLNEILSQNPSNTISTYVTKRIAAFFGLYVKTQQGQWLEVADPLMIATGLYSVDGTEEAILPAIHSEWVIDVTTSGGVSFNVVWYEGDDGIGFFPGNMYVLESWVGVGNGETLQNKDAVRAVHYMSLLGDILRRIYVERSLYDFGYGITGVCDDACGAIELLTYGESSEYPNQIIRAFVLPEIIERIGWRDRFSSYYYDLLTTVSSMPEDWAEGKDPSAPARALGTIVWPPGKEPFQCVVDARKILNAIVNERNITATIA